MNPYPIFRLFLWDGDGDGAFPSCCCSSLCTGMGWGWVTGSRVAERTNERTNLLLACFSQCLLFSTAGKSNYEWGNSVFLDEQHGMRLEHLFMSFSGCAGDTATRQTPCLEDIVASSNPSGNSQCCNAWTGLGAINPPARGQFFRSSSSVSFVIVVVMMAQVLVGIDGGWWPEVFLEK